MSLVLPFLRNDLHLNADKSEAVILVLLYAVKTLTLPPNVFRFRFTPLKLNRTIILTLATLLTLLTLLNPTT